MAHNRKRSVKDVGGNSPASGSAKEALVQGAKSGPQGERPASPTGGKQPPQTSGRRSAKHEHRAYEPKSFTPEEDPAQQGGPHTKPDVLKRNPSMQGLAGRAASGARADDVEETAQSGSPKAGHARHGREKVPGDRKRKTP